MHAATVPAVDQRATGWGSAPQSTAASLSSLVDAFLFFCLLLWPPACPTRPLGAGNSLFFVPFFK